MEALYKRFEALEKACKKYYLRKKLRLLLPLIVLGIGGALFFFFVTSYPYMIQQNVSLSPSSSTPKPQNIQTTPPKRQTSPCYSLQFMYAYNTMEHKLREHKKFVTLLGHQNCYIKEGKILSNNKKQLFLLCDTHQSKNELQPSIQKAKAQQLDYVIVPSECKHLVTQDQNESNLSYEQTIFIASYYYKLKNYPLALQWAIKANNIDIDKEEAWVLYAKSLIKTGNKKKAIKILQYYLQHQDSPTIKKLLEHITAK